MIAAFVDICDKGNNEIKNFVKNKSLDEKIELKACLKEKITHLEKINIILFEGSICVAVLTQRTLWFLPMLPIIVIWLCVEQNKKAKYTKALSYLQDYWNEKVEATNQEQACELSVETYEQIRARLTKEIEQKVAALNEKRAEVDRQIEFFNELNNSLNQNSENMKDEQVT